MQARKWAFFFLISLLMSSVWAFDRSCVLNKTRSYRMCHLNQISKAERGNFAAWNSERCENRLIDHLAACLSTPKVLACKNAEIATFLRCQKRLNRRFKRGILKAGRSTACVDELEKRVIACAEASENQ